MSKYNMTQTNYTLPVLEKDTIDLASQRFSGNSSRYSFNVLDEMEEFNPVLREGLVERLKAYPNHLYKPLLGVTACVTYALLNEQAQREGKQLPVVTKKTLSKYNQQLMNEKHSFETSHKRFRKENRPLVTNLAIGVLAAAEDEETGRACMALAGYVHNALRAQARYDEMSGIEWVVGEE